MAIAIVTILLFPTAVMLAELTDTSAGLIGLLVTAIIVPTLVYFQKQASVMLATQVEQNNRSLKNAEELTRVLRSQVEHQEAHRAKENEAHDRLVTLMAESVKVVNAIAVRLEAMDRRIK